MVDSNVTLADSIATWSSGEGCEGTITDGGHNISFPGATCPGTVADPKLGPLQNNGGPTVTEAIAAGSPAVDAVPASGAGCEPTDQRGVLRPAGAACDSGAFELATPSASTRGSSGVGTASATLAGLARNPDLAGASASFQYGTSTAYGRQTTGQPIEATAAEVPFSDAVSGLAPGTTYHFRAVVSNATGVSYGADQTFTTAGTVAKAQTANYQRRRGAAVASAAPGTFDTTLEPGARPRPRREHHARRDQTWRDRHLPRQRDRHDDLHGGTRADGIPRGEDLLGQTAATRPRAHPQVHPLPRYREVHAQRCRGHEQLPFHRPRARRALVRGRYRLKATPRASSLTGNTVSVGFSVV